jgi:small nuclear ribonucleoprotein (snRNP)-like protein
MRPDRIVRSSVRCRFLVTLKSGLTWDGILYEADVMTLVLRDAKAIGADGSKVEADSEVFLPRADVAYMQRLTG